MARTTRTTPGTDDWKTAHWPYTMPCPEAKEGGPSMWELWQAESRRLDLAFARTQPPDAAPRAAASVPAPNEPELSSARRLSADLLMTVARRNNRMCPRPGPWTQLYQLLEGHRFEDLQPPPVAASRWPNLSPLEKRLRFREHVRWAARHGRLKQVASFMGGMAEADWLHLGEV